MAGVGKVKRIRGPAGKAKGGELRALDPAGLDMYRRGAEGMCGRSKDVVSAVRQARRAGKAGAQMREVLGWGAEVGRGAVDTCRLVVEGKDPNAKYTTWQTWTEWAWQLLRYSRASFRRDALESFD